MKPLKFLGLIYNPFTEKLQANTRKGARTILETSKAAVFKGEKFIGVEDGVFTRERPYEKVGDVIESYQWRGTWTMITLWIGIIVLSLSCQN